MPSFSKTYSQKKKSNKKKRNTIGHLLKGIFNFLESLSDILESLTTNDDF